ncbi:hypothetical protein [Bifidobacterium moukalabense]|uniref:hypothetical protein n=1 Tax=Bifidobacterium moukalabense TaxID=1333651 RepID=UPI0010F4B900|nr:hypothetical protein [Bifidobacterium moukalabense]
MHFLGAVIGGNTVEEAEAIIAPWSDYAEVPEYVVQTRDEFLEECRERDRLKVERHPEAKRAAERLKLDDETALKAYADYTGKTLDGDGNVVSTRNRNGRYDWYEFGGRWNGEVKDIQGVTCRELLDRCGHDDGTAELVGYSLYVLCVDGSFEGDLWDGVSWERIRTALDEHTDEKVWFVDFHG